MKRFLAILGAVVMILVAVLIRGAMDDDSPFDRSGGKDRPSAAKPKLLCATELTDVCKAIEDAGIATVSVADSGTTIDLLAKERTANFDLWLTAGPWDQILADNLSFSKKSPSTPLLGTPGPIVARSPVIAVTLEQSATQRATAACPDGIALSCASSDPTLKVGVASPRRGDGWRYSLKPLPTAWRRSQSRRTGPIPASTPMISSPTTSARGFQIWRTHPPRHVWARTLRSTSPSQEGSIPVGRSPRGRGFGSTWRPPGTQGHLPTTDRHRGRPTDSPK
ncbi:MAG: hypothetical protein R2735_00950 [Microthrixaceae bacterium]